MNVNPTPVRMEAVVWLITLVEDLIVNVHWDSEEPRVWVGFLKKVTLSSPIRKMAKVNI